MRQQMLKKLALTVAVLVLPTVVAANSGAHELDTVRTNVTDKASLQRGAKLFVNYCLSCHSANYQRFLRMADDVGLSEQQVMDNLIFTGVKIGDTMRVAMPTYESKSWFGKTPPDLTVIGRSRGNDWLYSYLRGFYLDDSRPVGVNNLYFPDVGMPHVLWELQGLQKAVYREEVNEHGKPHEVFDHFEQVQEGSMTPKEYDHAMRDLVNYLDYMAEPAQLQRAHYGPYVIGFLIIFTILAFLLKKDYWRDIH